MDLPFNTPDFQRSCRVKNTALSAIKAKEKFYNKQGFVTKKEQDMADFLSALSHYGDGDELSNSLCRLKAPSFLDKENVILSEEHLIWSVYHMMGNIGSRILKRERY